MSRPAVRVRNRARHKMKASVRHGIHGKPQVCQKRGRRATTSHITHGFAKTRSCLKDGGRIAKACARARATTSTIEVPGETRYVCQTCRKTYTSVRSTCPYPCYGTVVERREKKIVPVKSGKLTIEAINAAEATLREEAHQKRAARLTKKKRLAGKRQQ